MQKLMRCRPVFSTRNTYQSINLVNIFFFYYYLNFIKHPEIKIYIFGIHSRQMKANPEAKPAE